MQSIYMFLLKLSYICLFVLTSNAATFQARDHPRPISNDLRPLRIKNLEPYVVERAEPTNSPRARAKGIRGDVVIELVYDELGNFMYGRVVKGDKLLREPAMEAIRKWKFKPQEVRGRPKKVIGKIVIHFEGK